ncbi:asparaginyl-tRNA synthetase, partial [Calocera cornea HHB12733]
SQLTTISGHILSLRRQKHIAFLHLSDGTSPHPLQVVLPPALSDGLNTGASVRLRGRLVKSTGKGQAVEFLVGQGEGEGTYPLQNKQIRPETLRENLHLRARQPRFAALLRLRHHLARETHAWFEENGFWNVTTPVLTSSDCEGAGEVFAVQPGCADPTSPAGQPAAPPPPPPAAKPHSILHTRDFFHTPAYLTVSSQLQLESLAPALARVYTLAPAFRAEPSLTHRHLAEFGMLEAEVGWLDPLDPGAHGDGALGTVMDVVEASVRRLLQSVLAPPLEADLRLLRPPASLPALQAAASQPWKRITYTRAVLLLQEAQASAAPATTVPGEGQQAPEQKLFAYDPAWGKALQSEHEKWLAARLGPVFVTHYPALLKPFYMRATAPGREGAVQEGRAGLEGTGTVECFDLVVPGIGELAGGSLREDRLPLLLASLAAHGLSEEEYGWYVDLRRYGGVPTGGYGLGWERLVSWVTGIENVRDVVPFPRW